MIVDMKKFRAFSALQPGTLFVVEQIPGLMAGEDATEQLVRGYWPSYNGMSWSVALTTALDGSVCIVPYFQDIYVRSGYPSLDEKGGVQPFTQYQQAPRAKIFRRDQSSVQNLATMQALMRSNSTSFTFDKAIIYLLLYRFPNRSFRRRRPVGSRFCTWRSRLFSIRSWRL
jgi:hypothetical protein